MIQGQVGNSLRTILGPIVTSLPRISKNLGKPAPEVDFLGDEIDFPEEYNRLLSSVFGHLMRNSVDHGIELPDERRVAGKSETGCLTVDAREVPGGYRIFFGDDGRGLNLARIAAIITADPLRTGKEAPGLRELLDAVFLPEFTTKSEATDISGRGIGMDAVRSFIRQVGGQIVLRPKEDPEVGQEFVPFYIQIDLPKPA